MQTWKPFALVVCVMATACGLIAGIEDVPDGSTSGPGTPDAGAGHHDGVASPGKDATMPGVDARGHDAASHDGSPSTPDAIKADVASPRDAGDALHEAAFDAPPGYVRCGATSTACDGDGGECCVSVYGLYAGDANMFSAITPECVDAGSDNCGSYGNVGNQFQMQFVQTCSSPAACEVGEVCCVSFPGPMPDPTAVTGIGCASSCTGLTICRTDTDCMGAQHCVSETDTVLSHVFARYCQ
jgi:hypothetical protein